MLSTNMYLVPYRTPPKKPQRAIGCGNGGHGGGSGGGGSGGGGSIGGGGGGSSGGSGGGGGGSGGPMVGCGWWCPLLVCTRPH